MSDSHSYSSPTPEPEPSAPGPSNTNPRKRARSEVSPEERREARAHRNRIAAQNSRDRKKAHFSHLEQRVAELEDENKRLRASMSLPSASTAGTAKTKEEEERKEKENAELRARIATLEQGLEAVVKAFTGQTTTNGTMTMATAGVIPTQSSVPFGGVVSSSTTTTPSSHPSTSATSTPPTTLTPSTDLSATTATPFSPAPSPSIHDLFSTPMSQSSASLPSIPTFTPLTPITPVTYLPDTGGEYTGSSPCFPAAGGSELSLDLYASALTPSQDNSSTIDTTAASSDSSCPPIALDDAAMETLFREILVNAHHGQDEGEDIDAGAKAEGVPSVDLLEGAGQQQAQAQGTTETEKTASAQVGVVGEATELMGSGGLVGSEMGFGMTDMEFDFENIGMDMDTSGISATWLNDDTTRLLEDLVASASTSNDATEPSTPPTSMSWESFEASLKASGVY
ncbi:hypothetical protein AAF712_015182 [Marasmius tenuissimus]|uniref:X-box-binding protein 1 n=1 Tax=Marasmius tenuissimus TaxID=585030 RepID=A0ABR2Z907_9AGAR